MSVHENNLNTVLSVMAVGMFCRRNFETINFWLDSCVLPEEMSQYPQRLSCNAWHLAENAHGLVVGFSGTSDSYRLLPAQVTQKHLPTLEGTDGAMLSLVIQNPEYVALDYSIPTDCNGSLQSWQVVLHSALEHKVDALIDCGALITGAVGHEAAAYMLPKLDQARFQGVVYYDNIKHNQWMVLDRHGRHAQLHCAAIDSRHAFVIFDEARCRGSDLKLATSAVALLTLSVKTTKDKLMQAAGRMRLLGKGQQIILAGPEEITSQIRSTSGLPAKQLPDSRCVHPKGATGTPRYPSVISWD